MGIFDRLFWRSKSEYIAPPRDAYAGHSLNDRTGSSSTNIGQRAFRFFNEEPWPADVYGVKSIQMAIEAASKATKEMFGDNETIVQKMIFERKGEAQLHLLALHVAVYYVLADRLCSSNRNVLNSVAKGIAFGIGKLFDGAGAASEKMAQSLYELFQEYAESLVTELKSTPSVDNSFDMGATADLVAEYISKQCQISDLLTDNPVDELRIKMLVACNGIRLLLVLLSEKQIRYN